MIDSTNPTSDVRSTDASPGASTCCHGPLVLRSASSVCHDRGGKSEARDRSVRGRLARVVRISLWLFEALVLGCLITVASAAIYYLIENQTSYDAHSRGLWEGAIIAIVNSSGWALAQKIMARHSRRERSKSGELDAS